MAIITKIATHPIQNLINNYKKTYKKGEQFNKYNYLNINNLIY